MSVEIHAHSSARMAEIARGEATLVLTGPPYFPKELEDTLADIDRVKRRIDELEREILAFAARLRPVFEECARVLSPRGVLILQTRDVRLAARLVAVEGTHRLHAESLGFHLYTRHEWRADYESVERRRDTRLATKRGQPRPSDAEVFLVFFRDLPPAPGTPTDEDLELLAAPTLRTARGRVPFPHRHQSPLPVIETLLRCYSQPGDLVVEPFAGGGSTLMICAALGRRGIGYEIDADALALARRNLQA
jgi:DNA modification methylase